MATYGPFTKTQQFLGPASSTGGTAVWGFISQKWSRQDPPYTKVLPYELVKRFITSIRDGEGEVWTYAPNSINSGAAVHALNKCFARFADGIKEQAGWAETFAEHRSARDTLTKRTVQMLRFARALRRLDLRGASRALETDVIPKGVKRSSQHYSGNFLEYQFFWAPVVKDIAVTANILAREFPVLKFKERGTSREWKVTKTTGFGNNYTTETDFITSKCEMGAIVQFTNANSLFASQLGITNLPGLAWDLVPMSFVLDMFTNVGQYLSQWDAFTGVKLIEPYTSTTQRIERVYFKSITSGTTNPGTSEFRSFSYFQNRTNGITGPELAVRPFHGFSVGQAATLVALLLQFLPKK